MIFSFFQEQLWWSTIILFLDKLVSGCKQKIWKIHQWWILGCCFHVRYKLMGAISLRQIQSVLVDFFCSWFLKVQKWWIGIFFVIILILRCIDELNNDSSSSFFLCRKIKMKVEQKSRSSGKILLRAYSQLCDHTQICNVLMWATVIFSVGTPVQDWHGVARRRSYSSLLSLKLGILIFACLSIQTLSISIISFILKSLFCRYIYISIFNII